MALYAISDVLAWQVRGHIQESQVTINYAIGRNTTEGRTHTMCIEGTHGIVVGMGAMGMSPA